MNREFGPWDGDLKLMGGRTIAYRVYGLRTGRPVYFFHGFPGSRLQAALVHDAAVRCGVSLVAFDRPGFGGSTWMPAPAVDPLIADVSHLADHLGHNRFVTLGVSCGGPYALAAARLLPHRVVGVGLLGGMGPMDVPAIRHDQMPALKVLFGLARNHPWLVSPLLAIDWLMFRTMPFRAVDVLSRALSAPDQKLLATHPEVREAFALSLREAYRQGIRGPMEEARRIANQGSASLQGVRVPVHVYQSGHDHHVPVAMGQYLADHLPTATLHMRWDEGHLSIVVNSFEECVSRIFQDATPSA